MSKCLNIEYKLLDGKNKVVNKIVQKLDSLRRQAHIAVEIPKWASKELCDGIKTFDWILHEDHWQWLPEICFQTSGQQMSCCLLLANLKIVRAFSQHFENSLKLHLLEEWPPPAVFFVSFIFWHGMETQLYFCNFLWLFILFCKYTIWMKSLINILFLTWLVNSR